MSSSSGRNTNACESFNAKFNKSFYTPYPDIISFKKILKIIQIDIKIVIQTFYNTPRKMRSIDRKKKLHSLKTISRDIRYQSDKITRFDFVNIMSFKNQTNKIYFDEINILNNNNILTHK